MNLLLEFEGIKSLSDQEISLTTMGIGFGLLKYIEMFPNEFFQLEYLN